jgi:hypothetical protein
MAAEKRSHENEYNAKGSPEGHEAEEDKAEFKDGGAPKKRKRRAKKAEEHKEGMASGGAEHEHHKEKHERHRLKDGGKAEGHESRHRLDKPSRKRSAGGNSPYTSGHKITSQPEMGKEGAGHEGVRPPEEDD